MGPTTSDHVHDNAPFPTRQLASLALCRLAEPVAFISIVAYTFVMVQDIKGDKDTAFWAGLLVSAFAVAEASTAVVWGSISDRYGRKPIIILGLLGTAISSLVLGFAKNYWVALLARFLGGLLNGNVAVMQTMVAEIVKNPKHEPRAYSVQPFMWSLGSIAGSALGGYAAQPARFYPNIFASDGVFGRYPYLLPNLVAVIIIMIAVIQAIFFLEETNPRVVHRPVVENATREIDERTPLRQSETAKPSFEHQSSGKRRPSFVAGSVPSLTEPNFDVRRSSFASIGSFPHARPLSTIESDSENSSLFGERGKPFLVFTKPVIMWIIAIALLCLHQMAFISVFPIFVLDQPRFVGNHLNFLGGLGLTVHDTGRYMAVNSCVSLFSQGVIFPIFVGKLGVWKSIVSMSLLCPIVDLLIPFITVMPSPGLGLYFGLAAQSFCSLIIYPNLLIMLKNATESSAVLGRVNGVAVSASCAARTLAPPLIGILYSSFGSAFAWWSCAFIGLVGLVELCFIPRPKRSAEQILRKASIAVDDDALED